MPTYNYSGDFYIKLLKDLYRKNGVTIPEADFATLQRLVDDERTRDEAVGSWQRVQDNRISASNLILPFTLIYSQKLEEDKSSIIIPISGNYNHLMLIGTGRNTNSNPAYSYLLGSFNGDTSANNQQQKLRASSTTLTGERSTSQTHSILGLLADGGRSANSAESFFVIIPHITSRFHKMSIMIGGSYIAHLATSFWTSDDSANGLQPVRSLEISSASGNIAAGSLVSVYGLL